MINCVSFHVPSSVEREKAYKGRREEEKKEKHTGKIK